MNYEQAKHRCYVLLRAGSWRKGQYLVDPLWRHGAIVEAQERSYSLLTPTPVTLTPQVEGVVTPADCVRHADWKTGVQVGIFLTQTSLCGQKPEQEYITLIFPELKMEDKLTWELNIL